MTTPIEPANIRESLEIAQTAIVKLYRAATPHGNYDDNEFGNRFADKDDGIIAIRRALAALAQTAPAEVVGEPVGWETYDLMVDGFPARTFNKAEADGWLKQGRKFSRVFYSTSTQAEAKEAVIRECIAIVEGRAKEYEALLDKGKGEHGQPGYVRDSTWDSWQGHHSEASKTVTLLSAILTEGEANHG